MEVTPGHKDAATLNAPAKHSGPFHFIFQTDDRYVSRLVIDKGVVSFQGDADASAHVFFDSLTRKHAVEWIELERRLQDAESRLALLTHHNAVMHLPHQLAEAHRQLEAMKAEVARENNIHYSENIIHCNKHCFYCKQESVQALENDDCPEKPKPAPGAYTEQ